MLLNKQGIAASSGSACTSGSLEPSHVMRAMDIPYTAAHGTIRFSLSRFNTQAEIDRVIEAVPHHRPLRKLSPYWGEDGPVAEPERPSRRFTPDDGWLPGQAGSPTNAYH
jgi:cysteine desulfurase